MSMSASEINYHKFFINPSYIASSEFLTFPSMIQETHSETESHDLDQRMTILVHASELPSKQHKTAFI